MFSIISVFYFGIPVLVYASARLAPKSIPWLPLAAGVVFVFNAMILGSSYHLRYAYQRIVSLDFGWGTDLVLISYGWSLFMALPVFLQAWAIRRAPSNAGVASAFALVFHGLTLPATWMLWLLFSLE